MGAGPAAHLRSLALGHKTRQQAQQKQSASEAQRKNDKGFAAQHNEYPGWGIEKFLPERLLI